MARIQTLLIPILIGVLGQGFGLTAALAGEISGHIVITKTLTKKKIVLPAYPSRNFLSPVKQESTVSASEFSRLAVYLEGPAGKSATTSAKLTQHELRFDPEILIVPVGSTVSFPNEDPIFHNVFSLSKSKQFDLGYYPIGQTRIVRFEKAGVVQVYCHLHPQMSAAILIVDTPWYEKPNEDGTFTFSQVPAGSYEVVAWHKSAGFFKRRVELTESAPVRVDLTIPLRETEAP
ncbi:MAG: carboxypeptidase regulatory-like domain-containing protein [Terriglobia bacterium]